MARFAVWDFVVVFRLFVFLQGNADNRSISNRYIVIRVSVLGDSAVLEINYNTRKHTHTDSNITYYLRSNCVGENKCN